MRFRTALVASLALAALPRGEASAAGAVLASPPGAVAPGEARIAIASSPGRTTRWASLRLAGAPAVLAWVLPVRPGARVDEASDAWMEALEAATAPRVLPPPSAPACKSAWSAPGGAEIAGAVEHVATRPSLDVAVLEDAAALATYAKDWGFDLQPDVGARAEGLASQGFRFVAMVHSAQTGDDLTRTVRVTDDAAPALPLLLTRAGSSAVRVTAFAIGDGRASFGAAPPVVLDASAILWKADGPSTYASAREAALIAAQGSGWLVESAGHAPLFESVAAGVGIASIPSVVSRYLERAAAYGDADPGYADCAKLVASVASSLAPVSAACPAGALAIVPPVAGGATGCVESTAPGPIAPSKLRCGARADDVALALSGLVPASAFVTRAAGVVPALSLGVDVPLAFAPGAVRAPIVHASGYDLDCPDGGAPPPAPVPAPTSEGPASSPPSSTPPLPPQWEDPAGSAASSGESSGGFFFDFGCSGGAPTSPSSSSDSCGSAGSGGSDTSSDSCGSAGSGGSDTSSDSCGSGGSGGNYSGDTCSGGAGGGSAGSSGGGGDTCSGSSGAGGGGGNYSGDTCSGSGGSSGGGGASSNCSVVRRAPAPMRLRLSAMTFGLLAILAPLRRRTRRRWQGHPARAEQR